MNRILKRGIAGILGCTMLFSSNFNIRNHKNEVKAASKEDIRLHGIDVSHHQKEIDWKKVKASGIDYAIIRCGYGQDVTLQDDVQWKANADGCTEQGIPFGVYLYSYATTVEGAEGEADHVLRLIEGYNLQYPVYYDIEYSKQKELSSKELGKIASAFAKKIENAGYQVGIYASYSWFNEYLTDPVFDQWERWVARYNTYCGYSKSYSMWQYSSSGTVSGIDSSINVDMDYVIGTDVITRVNEISCEQTDLELKAGESAWISAEVLPKNALNKDITWTSSNEKVAIVSDEGEIKAIGAGKAKLVAVSADNTDITASCNITVSDTAKPTDSPSVTVEPTEQPEKTQKPTETPDVTVEPTNQPEKTSKPTETPNVTAKPTELPKVTVEPTVSPKVTVKPTTKVTTTPKPTIKVTMTPKPTPKVTETPKPVITVPSVKGLDYQAISKNEIKLNWKKVSGVDGYVIYRYDSETKKDISLTTIKKNQITSYQVKKINGEKGKVLSPGTKYTYKVASYKAIDGKKYYSKKTKVDAITKPDTVKIQKVKRTSATKAKAEWKNVSQATGYVVYISDKKNGPYQAYKTVVGKKKKSIIISNLKKKKTYYLRISAYLKHSEYTWYGNYCKTTKISPK